MKLRIYSDGTGELYHHGVKGMKWGVRNYQNPDGSLTAKGKQRVKDKRINAKIEQYIKSGKAKVKDLEHYEVGELTTMTTPAGKKYVSGLIQGHDFDWQEVTRYSDLNNELVPTATVIGNNPNAHKIASNSDAAKIHARGELTWDDMRECNPGFGNPGTTQNCAKCSATLELRKRGYSISAGRQIYPSSADAQSLWFKDAQRVDYDSDFAQEALQSYGSKTSGTISIRYPHGAGGHSMYWYNDVDNNFRICDGQNGKVFSSVQEMMNTYGADVGAGVSTFRLDNCEPNWDMLAQDSVIRRNSQAGAVRNKNSGKVVSTW